MPVVKTSVGEILVQRGYITREQLNKALELQRRTPGEPLLKILLDLEFIDDEIRARILSEQWNIPYVDIITFEIEKDAVKLADPDKCKKYCFIPLKRENSIVYIAISDPTNVDLIDYLRISYGNNIKLYVASRTGIEQIIEKYFLLEDSVKEATIEAAQTIVEGPAQEVSIEQLREMGEDAPVIRVVNNIISQAITEKASDIHVEPQKDFLRIRYRIDGVLQERQILPKNIQPGIISRFKIMSNLDIAERRLPQDGRISLKFENKYIDFRVSTLPAIFGEKVVLRILDKSTSLVSLESLGFLTDTLKAFENIVTQPYGMILISGPTGAGKTTTLYSVLSRLNVPTKNILTVEDPVEYQLDGINQVQVNVKAGLTFANALRSFLRQDPNIILVGEIRDEETARIAMEAALTGHLVLSTIHTNDAPSIPTRLIDMGIEPFLIASSLIGTTAQRLARKICVHCREEYVPDKSTLLRMGLIEEEMQSITFFRGRGCDRCNYTGYKGRTGIHEVMKIDEEIQKLILKKSTARDISVVAKKKGMRVLLEDALVKAKEGIISVDELLRVISTAEIQ